MIPLYSPAHRFWGEDTQTFGEENVTDGEDDDKPVMGR